MSSKSSFWASKPKAKALNFGELWRKYLKGSGIRRLDSKDALFRCLEFEKFSSENGRGTSCNLQAVENPTGFYRRTSSVNASGLLLQGQMNLNSQSSEGPRPEVEKVNKIIKILFFNVFLMATFLGWIAGFSASFGFQKLL